VPVVTKPDPLYKRLESLANEHVRLVATHLPMVAIRALSGNDEQKAFAVAYHDVSWEVLRQTWQAGWLPRLRLYSQEQPRTCPWLACATLSIRIPSFSESFEERLEFADRRHNDPLNGTAWQPQRHDLSKI
jgi:hypothetical protein